MAPKLPEHINGLLNYLRNASEDPDGDLARGYFRKLFSKFTRGAESNNSDGYVPGHLVIEIKTSADDWLKAFFQGLTQVRSLSFTQLVVVSERFLTLWNVSDIPDLYVSAAAEAKGPARKVGEALGKTYKKDGVKILKASCWKLDPTILDGLFAKDSGAISKSLEGFENKLKNGTTSRLAIRPNDIKQVLPIMASFFDPAEKIKAVRSFYNILFDWNESSVCQLSSQYDDRAVVGAGVVSDLIPTKRLDFKRFIENYYVHVENEESYDDFFSLYDRALDSVDPKFRKNHGIFFTDISLSRFAMWYVRHQLGDIGKEYLILDPACGSGNLVTNWKSPLEMRHKVVSEIVPELLYTVDRRMNADLWHRQHGFTVVPKVGSDKGLNFIDRSAEDYLGEIQKELKSKNQKTNRPIAFLCNPPYKNDDDTDTEELNYSIDGSITNRIGPDAAKERYAAFLAQMKMICEVAEDIGLPRGSLLLVFTKSAWLMKRPVLENIRREIVGEFKDLGGLLVRGSEFFEVGKFPVLFSIWQYEGREKGLNSDRPIPVRDITWVDKAQLDKINWKDQRIVDQECRKILEAPKTQDVELGRDRLSIKEWAGVTRFNLYGNITKVEANSLGKIKSGFPLSDPRHSLSLDVPWGVATGRNVGFMGDRIEEWTQPPRYQRSLNAARK